MAIAEPNFIDRDPAQITSEMIAQYEDASGKKLYPAQAERLLIDLFAYRENLVRIAIQEAAKQNLVAYSRAPMLDYLGELVGSPFACAASKNDVAVFGRQCVYQQYPDSPGDAGQCL
jgi:hypothetical protein